MTADYVHAGIFVPVLKPSEKIEPYTFSPLGNTATKLVYWDEDAWASELMVSTGSSKLNEATGDVQARSAADEAAAAAGKEGLVKPGKETEAKGKKRKADDAVVDKQKKVRLPGAPNMLRTLTSTDGTGTFAILEQSPCRASWCQIF